MDDVLIFRVVFHGGGIFRSWVSGDPGRLCLNVNSRRNKGVTFVFDVFDGFPVGLKTVSSARYEWELGAGFRIKNFPSLA
jgi:hypothetical protein